MERIGEDTVTFVQIGKGAKSDRGIPQAVEESSTDVQWCSFQPLGVHYHVTDVSLPDATDRCLAPPVPAAVACKAGDKLIFHGVSHLVLGVRDHWDKGKLHHLTVITKRWEQ
ncbi:head closure [Mycobacterium phage Quink]|uniref:Head-to-tail stopper n=10 Tax=Viruses TaxID=10239 RepID=Q857Z6_9CAUD|nr:head closure [Mycobacterium phage Cjw1]YP_002014335.1 head closure [Mycobacterium phage Porky]YP_008051494.1 head closure [Mycobacterium phage Murphy]YP_008051640.1 head closure [Mycobacterium phage Dumbo]YP_008051951.1 head closure [Mycobacterium phage Phrux]YP_008409409.1 head closure [Mycobacterium phage DrDrey]YP_008531092.1 head closure [Mycobacterium phage Quink]YP_008857502.1 head closure [Mycobacterium phage PhatBacter]YP_008858743.1 head closure [Mycobacterium phage HufflyPuff]